MINEWGVVGVLVVLIGLFSALIKPIVTLTKTVALNTFATEALTKTISVNETRNEKDHEKLWTELCNHDNRIDAVEKIVL